MASSTSVLVSCRRLALLVEVPTGSWLGDTQRCSCTLPRSRRKHVKGRSASLPDDCLFCRLAREGDHVAKADGFVAIRDINPRADTHLLVLPERHLDTFRDIGALSGEESKRLLGFVAETARGAGLEDYRVLVNVGSGAGQAVFHLHVHVLGGEFHGVPA